MSSTKHPIAKTLLGLISQAQRHAITCEKWYAYTHDIHAKILADRHRKIEQAFQRVYERWTVNS